MKNPTVSVVLGSYNRNSFLKLAIESVRREVEKYEIKSEIIVVDGGSTDGSLSWLVKQKDIISIIQHNRGVWRGKDVVRRSWGYFMNLGFNCAKGKYICMISDDCLLLDGAIKKGISLFEKEIRGGRKIGAIAFYFRDWPYCKKYHVNVNFDDKLYVNHGLFLREIMEKVGFANEDDYNFYGADIDLMMKFYESGFVCLASEQSFVEHFADANNFVRRTNTELMDRDVKSLSKKWSKKYGKIGGMWVEAVYDDPDKLYEKFYWLFLREQFVQFMRSPIAYIKGLTKFLNEKN